MAKHVNQAPPKVANAAVVNEAVLNAKPPHRNPMSKAEKLANSIARNKRRAETRAAKHEARLAAMTPEERATYDTEQAALQASVQAKLSPPIAEDDKPIVSYDTSGTEDATTETKPFRTDGKDADEPVAETTVANDTADNTAVATSVDDKPTESPPVVASEVIEAPIVTKETRKERQRRENRERQLAKNEAKKARAAAMAIDADAVIAAETETRNGDAPTEATPANDTELLTANTDEEQHVDEALVEAGSFAEAAKREKEAANEPVVEERVDVPAVEAQPAETVAEPLDAPVADVPAVEQPAEEAVPETPAVEAVADKKPTLTLVSDNPLDPKMVAGKKFYGEAFTPERAELLASANFWLDTAIRTEAELKAAEGNSVEVARLTTKLALTFKTALKKEAEAFGVPMAMAA